MIDGVCIRQADARDRSYIISSWLESHHDRALGVFRRMPSQEYFVRWRLVIAGLLDTAQCYVACPTDDSDTVLAWVCVDVQPRVARMHYAHTKLAFQRLGLMRALLTHAGVRTDEPLNFSHRTTVLDAMTMPDTWRYAPWMLVGIR